jgi:hypothetical protein
MFSPSPPIAARQRCTLIGVTAFFLFCLLAAGDRLGYAGLGLDTDLNTLPGKYPSSQHEFWPKPSGEIVYSRDNGGYLRVLVREGSGAYFIRLNSKEAHDHVYLIQADLEKGAVRRLRISFEMPPYLVTGKIRNSDEAFEKRHPACSDMFDLLGRSYGQPQAPKTSAEERLNHTVHTWVRGKENLSLDCGHYSGRKPVFAMEVVLTPR